MSYGRLFYLRFMQRLSTLQLEKLFPDERRKICMIALCSLPDETLHSIVRPRMAKRISKLRQACFRRWAPSANHLN